MNKKNKYLLSIFLLVTTSSKAIEPEASNSKKKKQLFINITTHNSINNEIKNTSDCECAGYFGNLLDQCMDDLENDRYLQNLNKLTPVKRKKHLNRTLNTFEDYKHFFERFTPEEWEEFWNKLTPEEQKFLPKSEAVKKEFMSEKRINEIMQDRPAIDRIIIYTAYIISKPFRP